MTYAHIVSVHDPVGEPQDGPAGDQLRRLLAHLGEHGEIARLPRLRQVREGGGEDVVGEGLQLRQLPAPCKDLETAEPEPESSLAETQKSSGMLRYFVQVCLQIFTSFIKLMMCRPLKRKAKVEKASLIKYQPFN